MPKPTKYYKELKKKEREAKGRGARVDWMALMRAREAAIVERLRWLVEHETPTDAKAAVDALGRALATAAADLGGAVSLLPQTRYGDLVRVDSPGAARGRCWC